jgi:tetratricopeptide (TPR) repeat protein
LSEVHAELGLLHMFSERNWAAAEREFKLGLQLAPQSFNSHQLYSYYLQAMGRLDEATAELQRSKDLNPTAAVLNVDFAWIYIYARQYDRAIVHCQKALELDRDLDFAFAAMGLAYAQLGRYEEAIDTFGKMPASGKDNPAFLSNRGYIYARWGKHDEARRGIAELQDLASRRFVHSHELAIAGIYAGLADRDRAIQWLRKACEAGAPWLVILKVDPTFDNLHSDPRFQKIIADMKFPP